MQHRQKPDENIDDFVTRARTLAQKCQFSDEVLNERLIELIIASTPHDALRNDLYSKPKGYSLAQVLAEGQKYEALTAGNEQLGKLGLSHERIHAVDRDRTCRNCGRSHKPRQCPAYNDECKACGAKGHWERCCRKSKRERQRNPSQSRSQGSKSHTPHDKQHKRKPFKNKKQQSGTCIHAMDSSSETESEDESTYQKQFHSITISEKCRA